MLHTAGVCHCYAARTVLKLARRSRAQTSPWCRFVPPKRQQNNGVRDLGLSKNAGMPQDVTLACCQMFEGKYDNSSSDLGTRFWEQQRFRDPCVLLLLAQCNMNLFHGVPGRIDQWFFMKSPSSVSKTAHIQWRNLENCFLIRYPHFLWCDQNRWRSLN